MFKVVYRKDTKKHIQNLKGAKLDKKAKAILDAMKEDPFVTPPPFKQLHGDKAGIYSRRINRQHRIFYMVDDSEKEIYVLSMWNHDLD